MATQTATGVIQFGSGNYYGLGIKDANGNYAIAQTPFYQNSSGILIPAPVDANGNPQMSLSGSSAYDSDDGTAVTASTTLTPITPAQSFNYIAIDNIGTTDMQIKIDSGKLISIPASTSWDAHLAGSSFSHQTTSGTTTFHWTTY